MKCAGFTMNKNVHKKYNHRVYGTSVDLLLLLRMTFFNGKDVLGTDFCLDIRKYLDPALQVKKLALSRPLGREYEILLDCPLVMEVRKVKNWVILMSDFGDNSLFIIFISAISRRICKESRPRISFLTVGEGTAL